MASMMIVGPPRPLVDPSTGTHALLIALLCALNGCSIEVDPTTDLRLDPSSMGMDPGQSPNAHRSVERVLQSGAVRSETQALSKDEQPQARADRRGPNIRDPGPDLGDFPDSADVVPPGEFYVELSSMYGRQDGVDSVDTPFLVRVGIVENWEFRLSSDGVVHADGPGDTTTGYGPITVGFKAHIWEGAGMLPAFGIAGNGQIPSGSADSSSNRFLPTLSFNLDHTLPAGFSFSWNVQAGWGEDDDDDRVFEGGLSYSLVYDLVEDFGIYTHGDFTEPLNSGNGSQGAVGVGFQWILGDRVAITNNYNFGLNSDSPDFFVELGVSFAF